MTTRRYPPGSRSFLLTPHLQVGETVVTEVPGGNGILPHRSFQASTACGVTIEATLVTRDRERTHCQACYDASAPVEPGVVVSAEVFERLAAELDEPTRLAATFTPTPD